MPFNQITFLGASVRSVQSSIGWNSEPSRLIVSVVEDPANNDDFSPVNIGQPIYFQLGSFRFFGILERWVESKSLEGYPLFQCYCADPRSLLQATKLILSGYNGTVGPIRNLLNVYGYLENTGFGNSQVNDSGMPWKIIRGAIHTLTALPAVGGYGGPIRFAGFDYSVDLSELPSLPDYFRVGGFEGSNLSILDYIDICCKAANYDFFVELVGLSIKVRTHARGVQPPLGTIAQLVNEGLGVNLVANENGLELRNETTSSFLVGSPVQLLYKGENYTTFYGFDSDGQPIVGTPCYIQFFDVNNNFIGSIPTEEIPLYLPEVADILGSTYYLVTEFELRLALAGKQGKSYSTWELWIRKFRPEIAQFIDLTGGLNANPPAPPVAGNGKLPVNFIDDNKNNIPKAVAAAVGINFPLAEKSKRLFEAILSVASTYVGKAWAVALPFVSRTIEPETNNIRSTYDIAPAGYNEVENDLSGLPALYYNLFQTQEGLFVPFAYYEGYGNIDLERFNPNNSLTLANGDANYLKCQVDPKIHFGTFNAESNYPFITDIITSFPDLVVNGYITLPLAIVTTDGIFSPPDDFFGTHDIAKLLNAKIEGMEIIPNDPGGNPNPPIPANGVDPKNLARNGLFSRLPMGIHPEVIYPRAFHIPLRSNILRYGPWYAQGVPGSVNYVQNDTINPWTYGGYTLMNAVGNAFVVQEASTMQTVETGRVEHAGAPSFSLGDIMKAGGPNITRISIQYSDRGVTTSYDFETYVPRPGQMGKYNLDRLRRYATNIRVANNNARAEIQRGAIAAKAEQEAGRAFAGFLANLPPAFDPRTPHPSIAARLVKQGEFSACGISTATLQENLLLTNCDDYDEMTAGAMVSLDGIFWPYQFLGPTGILPYTLLPTGAFVDRTIANSFNYHTLTPASGNIQFMPWDDDVEYQGAQYYADKIQENSGIAKRSVGLRGPLTITGWGRQLDGSWLAEDEEGYPDYDLMCNSDKWRTGPVDLLWDNLRNVWTGTPVVKGILREELLSHSGVARLEIRKAPLRNSGTQLDLFANQSVMVRNWLNATIPSGTKAKAMYSALDNTYILTAADCS